MCPLTMTPEGLELVFGTCYPLVTSQRKGQLEASPETRQVGLQSGPHTEPGQVRRPLWSHRNSGDSSKLSHDKLGPTKEITE